MNSVNFEDSVFIINIRIKALRDTLRLCPPPELFLLKCIDDLAFINKILAVLSESLLEDGIRSNGNGEFENYLDAEWQFNQLLLEASNESTDFTANMPSDTKGKISQMRDSSDKRRKAVDEAGVPADIARSEPGVSSAELNSLFGGI